VINVGPTSAAETAADVEMQLYMMKYCSCLRSIDLKTTNFKVIIYLRVTMTDGHLSLLALAIISIEKDLHCHWLLRIMDFETTVNRIELMK